jgi:hypothetical protein
MRRELQRGPISSNRRRKLHVPNLPERGKVAISTASGDGNSWSVSCNAGQATTVAVCALKP